MTMKNFFFLSLGLLALTLASIFLYDYFFAPTPIEALFDSLQQMQQYKQQHKPLP